jgi:hypothetical protein
MHTAQGRTVDTSHVLVDGSGDRQGLYVAMSRGRQANYAYCVTGFPGLADVHEGSRPAAELQRAHRLAQERAGLGTQPDEDLSEEHGPDRDPASVLAEVLQRDGSVVSATETLRRELSDADHLGVLGSNWYDLARRAQDSRFERSLRDIQRPADADAALDDPACTWLWRSLREAEAAGLAAHSVLRQAIDSRPLTGARHVARVIDSQIRRQLAHTMPQLPPGWSDRVPDTGDEELNHYIAGLAVAMDDRVLRIGEHAAQVCPA